MRTNNKITSVLITLGFVLLLLCSNCQAQELEEKMDFEDGPNSSYTSPVLTDKLIEQEMKRLKRIEPKAFKRLKELRERRPEIFEQEFRQHLHLRKPPEYYQKEGKPPRGGYHRPSNRGRPWGGLEMLRNRLEEFTQWLKENYPDQAEELAELKEAEPELYRRRLGLNFHKYREIFEASKKNPELAKVLKEDLELKSQRDELLKEISRAADKEKKEDLLKVLEVIVGKRFDIIVKKKQIEYEQLRERLKELEEQLQQSQARVEKWKTAEFKDKNVKNRVKELIQKTEKFRWD